MKVRGIADMLNKTIIISRQQLYDEIWQVSVAGVARKYKLNYSKLISRCKEANIPFPSSGYWTRRNMGKDVSNEVVELPPSNIETIELLLTGVKSKKKVVPDKLVLKKESETEINSVRPDEASFHVTVEKNPGENVDKLEIQSLKNAHYDTSILSFLSEDERHQVLDVATCLVIRNIRRLHEQLVKYKNAIVEWKQKEKEAKNRQYYNPRHNKPDNEPTFFNEISDAIRPRTMLILDAVFCAVEELGGKINSDLTIKIKSDTVRIRVVESQDKVKHELTKEEAHKLVEYNEEVKKYSWTSKPKIPKYDYVYNGRLRIVFGGRDYFRDSNSEKLEERLGDILIALYEKSEELRVDREKREEEQRKREEEIRRQEEIRKRKEDEIIRTKELVNKAEDYKIACEIRQYISAVAQEENVNPETLEWIEWAKKKADWYDPIIAAMDEYLGKREHSKSKEEKELNQLNRNRYGWGW